jgi:hypothetical protein
VHTHGYGATTARLNGKLIWCKERPGDLKPSKIARMKSWLSASDGSSNAMLAAGAASEILFRPALFALGQICLD